jgi:putative inorganic carbon (hco3(-)) transporter
MRGLVFLLAMGGLLPMAAVAPMVGVITYYWISFMSPQMELWGIAAAPPWALLSVLATLIGCLVAREPKRLPANAMVVLVILFLILTSISSLFALGPPDRVLQAWTQEIKVLLFLLVLAALLESRLRLHALIWVMVISLGFYGVVGGLFAIVTGGHDRVWGPPDSIIGDNNQLAVALLIVLPLMNYLRLHSAHGIVRKGLAIAMLLTFLSVLASYSRGALIGLAAMGLFLWWNSRHRLLTGAIMALVLAVGLSFMPADWTDRMMTIDHYQHDPSAEARLTVWGEAFGIALARPFTGGGYKSTVTPQVLHQFYPDAKIKAVHSIWFEVLSENGFPAFFVWLAMMLLGFLNVRRVRRLARGDPALAWAGDFARMAEVSLIAYLSAGSFLSMGYYDLTFALLVALAATRDILRRAASAQPASARPSSVPLPGPRARIVGGGA